MPGARSGLEHIGWRTNDVVRFAAELHTRAAHVLADLRLDSRFVAVHWRSESTPCAERYRTVWGKEGPKVSVLNTSAGSGCNLTTCATAIAEGVGKEFKQRYETNSTAKQCLLISDIPVYPEKPLWQVYNRHLHLKTDFNASAAVMVGAMKALGVIGTGAESGWGGCTKIDLWHGFKQSDAG